MATFYSVIQFVPDPVADERMNAGVVVFGNGRILRDSWRTGVGFSASVIRMSLS